MRKKVKSLLLSLVLCLQLIVPVTVAEAATTLYDNETGNQDGYDYELWKDYGTTSMTLNSGGTFSCQWSDIGNALFRKGIKFDCTKTYSQIGTITVDYGSDYQPSGNSYLCVYGWSKDPLVEYYIVESWGTWRPPGATSKGTITVDGGTYDVYETTREQQPSIEGTKTFQQYWSVRTSKRTSGTISVTEHFKAWERMGLQLGKIYETALTVEGYQSSGSANVYKNTISVGTISGNTGNTGGSTAGSGTAVKIECEDMSISGQYAGNISSPFSGVALYANNDACSFTQYFASSTHDFTLRGASDGSNMAKVDLVIGGDKKGTFYFGDQYPAEYTIKNVSHGTGEQTIELVVSEDDGNWDAFVDYLYISGVASSGNTGNEGADSSASDKVECEAMSISGQYAGNISSPFSGVALYANNDACSFTQYFASSTHDFTLRGASDGSNMAKVDLVIGGVTKGTFYFGDQYPAEYTIKNVSHGTGDQTIELVVTEDDGQWDVFVDYLTISAPGTAGNSGNAGTSGTITSSTKMVALTFDDGPSVTTTTQILDILERYDVKATFFLIGNEINSSTQSILQRQSRLGHELANHSYSHSDMTTMSWSQVQNEINQTSSSIKNITGQTVKFFRPPYISVNSTMYSAIDLAFIQGIMCDDWVSSTSASQRAQTVLSSVSDGSIILLHDFEGNTNTVEALPTIIEGLKAQGYTFVTLSEMFQAKGKNPNVDNKIWSNVND